MTATLSRSGTGYSLNDQRTYSAWGEIRSGTGTGDPKGRYVASLGHKQDDESGLIYMRARYYEPQRGRFISEDLFLQGLNWFSYCSNNPVDRCDESGKLDSIVKPTSLLSMFNNLFLLVCEKFGLTPDAKMLATSKAISEAAKVLTMLEGSLMFLNIAQGLSAMTPGMLALGAFSGLPGLGLGFGILTAGAYGISGALAVASFVTLINASYSIVMIFLDE